MLEIRISNCVTKNCAEQNSFHSLAREVFFSVAYVGSMFFPFLFCMLVWIFSASWEVRQ